MAERRMLAKTIVTSDAFLDMPSEAQALYLQLNMAADDWGACSNPRSIMRLCGASNDAMKILIAKKFVLTFEKGDNLIVVIKHWNQHNWIRSDRKNESKFKEVFRGMYLDENGNYSLNAEGHTKLLKDAEEHNDSQVSDTCLTDDSQVATQVRLGKDRIGKDSIGKVSIDKDSIGQSMNEPQGGNGSQKYDLDTCNERIKRLVKTGLIKEADGLYDYYRQLGINVINPEEVTLNDN